MAHRYRCKGAYVGGDYFTTEEIAAALAITPAAAARRIKACGATVTWDRLRKALVTRFAAASTTRKVRLMRGWWHVRYQQRDGTWGPWIPYCGIGEPK